MIFRNDDVNPNTNLMLLAKLYDKIIDIHPKTRIISGITLFSSRNTKGSVYAQVPFKNNELDWFYDVDRVFHNVDDVPGEIASHGLLHVDHSKLSKDAQEMSILTSCRFLKTRIFIPPFNKVNRDTLRICFDNKIEVLFGLEWKSFEFEKFTTRHKYWYFHSWRFSLKEIEKVIDVNSGDMGQLQTNATVSS